MVDAWAMDFIRALNARPVIIKIMLRVIFGRYAYREFIGMIDAIEKAGYFAFFDYDLEKSKYHNDKIPLKWWRTWGEEWDDEKESHIVQP